MSAADTPMPGEDPGTPPDPDRDGETDPATEMPVEGNPQPEPDSSLPPDEDDAETAEPGRHPT